MIREKIGISQSRLADNLGVSARTVQNWESDIDSISKSGIEKINAFLESINYSEHEKKSMNGEGLKKIRESFNMTQTDFGKMLGVGLRSIQNWENDNTPISETARLLLEEKIKYKSSFEYRPNMIPFYENVESFGGTEYGAELEPTAHTGRMINAGDWFHGVTAAIRHFGDSMDEYPSGCVLALKELNNMFDFVPGQNYVVETDDMRVTKRLQLADDDKYIMAYSSNTETYPDGRQRHEPFKIRKETIRKIFLVLGRVVNEHSSAPIFAK